MYQTIVVPTDGSEHAVRAAEHGRYLARRFDATVHVVNVVDLHAAAGPFDAGGVDEEFVSRLEAEGERTIEAVEEAVGASEAMRTAVLRGRPDEAILEYADEHGADLLVMGTHGRTGLNRYIAGSVTERVVRLADAPVLTVRETAESRVVGDYEEILVPTDGSERAGVAVDHGVAIAESSGARVHAVNVVDVGSVAATPAYSLPSGAFERMESDGREATENIAAQARSRGLEAVTAVREGSAARSLLDYVEENDIDLIAMGTAGRTGINRLFLGSTTERIVRHADVPVLAVNTRGERSD